MPATQYPKIVAFIEGTMERLFVNNNFHYVDVVKLSNGSGWSVPMLCKQIGTLFYAKNVNPDHIVVWLDMEKQSISPQEFREAILAELATRGADLTKVAICIPNRMTENIILADESVMQAEFNPAYRYTHEGANGKKILAGLYSAKGIAYKETQHGAALMKKIRLQRAAINSPSAKSFLEDFNVQCWWLQS